MPSLFFRIRASAYCNDYFFGTCLLLHSFQSWGSSFCISFSANVVSYIFSSSFDDGSASLSIMVPFSIISVPLSSLFYFVDSPVDQFYRKYNLGWNLFTLYFFHNRFYGIFAHFPNRLMNGRNGRIRQCGNPGIIESHNRDILRNTFSHFLHARIIFAAITSLVAKIPSRSEFFSIIPKYCCRILLIREPTCLYKPHVH